MTLGAVLRFTGLTTATAALALLIVLIIDVPIALFCLFVTVFGLGLYCIGCLIPEPIDDPVN